MAFRDLVLFLVFESASIPRDRSEEVSPNKDSQNIQATWSPSFASAQALLTYKRCKTTLKDHTKIQIVTNLNFNKPKLAKRNFDMVSGEDMATLIFFNLQNLTLTEQGDFLLTELYTDYAIKMVRQSRQ